ncbi:hypothetical protein FRB96_000841 [Tulasnella sp. 330]|nr:hypothetical protein FRB96_000841 [Tulasnella sp. 330]
MADPDQETERLIAQMLMEDLSFLEDQATAESFQVAQAMTTSKAMSGLGANLMGSRTHADIHFVVGAGADDISVGIDDPEVAELSLELADYAAAFRAMTNDTVSAADASLVASMNNGLEGAVIRDYQAALKIAAEERRSNLDHEFAKRLQAVDDAGETDVDVMIDADQVLGKEMVEGILASDLNCKGKGRDTGKSKAIDASSYSPSPFILPSPVPKPTTGILKCGICHEAFLQTRNPLKASQTPNSSSRVTFGQVFPCPGRHGYCIDCTTNYIRSKLEDGGSDRIVFPIRCPECSPLVWQMDDETATSVLSPDLLDMWHHQKLLESLPKFWCPSGRCSELIATDDELEGVQAACPSCQTQICVACRSIWHNNLTCEEYQDMPEGERMPEDLAVLELARAEKWRRCGSDWDDKCTRDPPCELWEEDMLLEERERARYHIGLPAAAAAAAAAAAIRPVAVAGRGLEGLAGLEYVRPLPPVHPPAGGLFPPPPPAPVIQPPPAHVPRVIQPLFWDPEPVRYHNEGDDLDWVGEPV